MKVISGFSNTGFIDNAYLTIGVYDGVHLGHQKVLKTLVSDAKACDGKSVVITFHPHPLRVLSPDTCPPLITSTGHKMRLLDEIGIDYCFVVQFDLGFSGLSPQDFAENILFNHFDINEICVGYDCSFGKGKEGNVDFLYSLSDEKGFILKNISPVKVEGLTVSSTQIRKLIVAGEFELIEVMLGRRYSLYGTVVSGYTIGRKIGYPTANLDPHHEAVPPSGVYIVEVLLDGQIYNGLLNIGYRPTFKLDCGLKETIEVYILDFNSSIYGKDLEVFFLKKIRDEHRFADVKSLVSQIEVDEKEARRFFSKK